MIICSNLAEWTEVRRSFEGRVLGFVPTMGNLHEGHVSLFRRAATENDLGIASIFVNPTQFNDKQDFSSYPRTLDADVEKAKNAGIQVLLIPQVSDIYPDDFTYRVSEHQLSLSQEGAYRPGHFTGMLTIVLKLLLLVRPSRAYFGEKDYQQYQLVQGLARAFFLPTEIIPCPTIRLASGLAMSSRNNRLSADELSQAALFPKFLGNRHLSCAEVCENLQKNGFTVDYIEEINNRRFGAVHLGQVRLIDNMIIESKGIPS